jgi:DNA-binding transcriptional LysR family regulator
VVFANFAKTYPFIELNLQFNDSRPNIIEQGIDLAVRLGDLADSNLKAKKIGIIKRKLVCATDFYNQQSPPVEPSELVDWQWLHLQMLPTHRRLQHPKLGIYDIHYETQVTVDSVDAITQLCLLGLGLATPPLFLIEQALKEKKLIEVLPQWQVDSIPMYAVWPENQISNNLTQLLLNYLAQHNTELIEH